MNHLASPKSDCRARTCGARQKGANSAMLRKGWPRLIGTSGEKTWGWTTASWWDGSGSIYVEDDKIGLDTISTSPLPPFVAFAGVLYLLRKAIAESVRFTKLLLVQIARH